MSAQHVLVALVVLPERYNPDERGGRRQIEDEKFEWTMHEVAARFGGGVLWRVRERPPKGFWWDRGVLHQDETSVLEVDIPNEVAARNWIAQYARDTLIPRFEQEAMYIRFVGPIEVDLIRVNRSK